MTFWGDKENFNAWRTGEAFKEAHGGGGITDFIQLLTTAIFILDGAPKPAFYDALEVASPKVEGSTGLFSPYQAGSDGWKKVFADGESLIDPDIFVVQRRYRVIDNKNLELSFKEEQGKGVEAGQLGSCLMRRDADKADDGFNYIHLEVWPNKNTFDHGKKEVLSAYSPEEIAFFQGKLTITNDGL